MSDHYMLMLDIYSDDFRPTIRKNKDLKINR